MQKEDGANAQRQSEPQVQAKNTESKDFAPSVNFLAGGLVSAVSKMVVYPMETKVFLIAVGQAAASDPLRLWHGVNVQGFSNFLYNGLLWVLKDLFRPPAGPDLLEKRPPVTMLGAFVASCVCILLAHPSANVVVGMQASLRNLTEKPLSALQVARAIVKADGLSGFFTGWQLSILLRVGSALTLVVYEFVRTPLAGVIGGDLANFVAGLLGRLSEVYSVQPIKTLRSRQQLGQPMLPALNPSAIMRLWAGVGTMAVADAIKIGVRFLLIERLRTILQWALISRHRQRPQLMKAVKAEDAETAILRER